MSPRLAPQLLLTTIVACSSAGVQDPPAEAPTGPPPEIRVTAGFGNAPLTGEFQLHPVGASTGWRYTIDFDSDGPADRDGILERRIGFLFSFEEPGIHRIPVLFERGAERVEVDALIGVNDPSSIEVIAEITLPQIGNALYEGLAIDHSGDALYAGDFWGNRIYRIPSSLTDVSAATDVDTGPEGIAVAPSDSLLYVIHKRGPLTVIAIPDMIVQRTIDASGFFVTVLDEFRAIATGNSGFDLVDTRSGEVLASNFDPANNSIVLDDRQRLVSLIRGRDLREIGVYSLPDLRRIRSFPLQRVAFPRTIALNSLRNHLYVLAFEEEHAVFQSYDFESGDLLTEITLPDIETCRGMCVANPFDISADGRTVVFETGTGNVFVDTELDMVFHHSTDDFRFGSVAASPTEPDVFYILRSDGLLTKLRVRSPD